MAIKMLENLIIPIIRINTALKIKKHVISIFDVIVKARTILILMPAKLEDFGVARNFLSVIHHNFPEAKLTIIMEELYKNLLDELDNYGTIFVTNKDINIWGLPKKEIVQKVLKIKYDIAIDLNHNFNLFSTHLCLKSGAVLRICLENKKRELFYNFSFRCPKEQKLENKYSNLFKYLNTNIIQTKIDS